MYALSFAGTKEDKAAGGLFNEAQQMMRDIDRGKKEEAADIYKEIIDRYPYSQYAISSIQSLQYHYNRFGFKWFGTNYFNSVIKRENVPEQLRAQAGRQMAEHKGHRGRRDGAL